MSGEGRCLNSSFYRLDFYFTFILYFKFLFLCILNSQELDRICLFVSAVHFPPSVA